jgi:mannose-6-phosphate isomerase-like protein (cupin superfamily)
MTPTDRSRVIRFTEAQARIPGPAGEHFATLVERGTLTAKLSLGHFAPRPNQQTPHRQDELYVIVRGRGVLWHDGRRDPFEAGDLLFVAAGTEHHFEEFSDDLAVWVLFYGAEGGEIPQAPRFAEMSQ